MNSFYLPWTFNIITQKEFFPLVFLLPDNKVIYIIIWKVRVIKKVEWKSEIFQYYIQNFLLAWDKLFPPSFTPFCAASVCNCIIFLSFIFRYARRSRKNLIMLRYVLFDCESSWRDSSSSRLDDMLCYKILLVMR